MITLSSVWREWGGGVAAVTCSLASVSHSADLGGRGSWDVAEQRETQVPSERGLDLGTALPRFLLLVCARGCL